MGRERDSFGIIYTGYLLSIVKIKREIEKKREKERKREERDGERKKRKREIERLKNNKLNLNRYLRQKSII